MLYCKLNNRSLISFVGKDIVAFLQGIITNDINKIKNNRAIYASLLSPQGKILKDFFLFKVGSKIYLDTTKESLETLEEKLNIYKINQEIKFSKENFFSYYIFYGKSINKVFNLLQKEGFFEIKNKVIIFNDPRKLILGCRIICLNENDNNKIKKIIKDKKLDENYDEYEKLRIINCIPDIEKDNLYNNAYLLQNNFDKINTICWKKGCFIGQEVTSRMKYKGQIKKKLYAIKSSKGSFKEKGDIKINTEMIGTIYSFHKNWALGLIEIEKAEKLKKKGNYLII
ncbi:MAG: tRNA-modifying protein YgfZ [Alphaproteobacteria bacterium MarineAlpha6_Bin2]|nr:MAG: tRNA-modifying protein YgfZ [Alphaproteobacteria bacterium MarineAlpha6_Bin2]